MQPTKQLFLTYRNGIVADTLRKAGMPYKIIFGLQLPQIAQIARETAETHQNLPEFADQLWADRNVRESRLLACYLFSPDTTDIDKALQLARDVQTVEEADILTFRLLRHLPFAPRLLTLLESSESPESVIKALSRNLTV